MPLAGLQKYLILAQIRLIVYTCVVIALYLAIEEEKMATTCVKDKTPEQVAYERKGSEKFEAEREAKATDAIQTCVQGKVSDRTAKAELAKLYEKPEDLQKAINKLEEARGSGITAGKVSVEMPKTGGRIMSYVDNKDNIVAFMITPKGETIPMVPNPDFRPMVKGTQIRFHDDKGMEHRNASAAAEANLDFHTYTGGNCGQRPETIPNWIPDPNWRR